MAPLNFPVITLEEHWCSQAVRDFYKAQNKPDPNAEDGLVGFVTPRLMEFGPQRLATMDTNGITLQVVSHAPNSIPLSPEVCTAVNDELHGLIGAAAKGRFAGFATLAMAHPEAAASELRRCVTEYGFLGTLIDSNCGGRYYDDDFFWPVFAAAEDLNVPIYLHPAPNETLQEVLYTGNYSKVVAETMSQFGWGWHNETAVHFLRLYAAGIFDRYPKLKMVLGHAGEMLPFQLDRIARIARVWQEQSKLERSLREVWDENVWITMSGMFSFAPMACVVRHCRPERIMFSVDYPFGHTEDGVKFIGDLKDEGLVDDEGVRMIAHKNAEVLLGVKAA